MRTRMFQRVTAAGLSAACAAGLCAGVVYQQDFEHAGAIGPEWSSAATERHGVFTRFTKRRANNTLTLTVATSVGRAYSLMFDLYVIDSWDGASNEWGGPDLFNVRAGDAMLFSESMDNDAGSLHATFRDPDEFGHFGFGDRPYDNDAIYRGVVLEFIATGESTAIDFFGSGLQSRNDESWGIDNVQVSAIPAPAAGVMLGAGLAALGLRRRPTD